MREWSDCVTRQRRSREQSRKEKELAARDSEGRRTTARGPPYQSMGLYWESFLIGGYFVI